MTSSSDTEQRRRSGIPEVVVQALARLPGASGEIAAGTASRLRDTRFVGLAAEVAFFAGAGTAPLIVAALVLLGELQSVLGEHVHAQVADTLRTTVNVTLTRSTANNARQGVEHLLSGRGLLIAPPLLLTVVLSSRGFAGAMRGLSHLYGVEEQRPVWKDALAAAGFTTVTAVLASLSIVFAFASAMEVAPALLRWGRWFVIPVALLALFTSLFRYTHHNDEPWTHEVPGAAFTTTGLIVAGIVYVTYLRSSPSLFLGPFFGALLGGVLATFSLLFFFAALVLIGGALNAERAERRGAS